MEPGTATQRCRPPLSSSSGCWPTSPCSGAAAVWGVTLPGTRECGDGDQAALVTLESQSLPSRRCLSPHGHGKDRPRWCPGPAAHLPAGTTASHPLFMLVFWGHPAVLWLLLALLRNDSCGAQGTHARPLCSLPGGVWALLCGRWWDVPRRCALGTVWLGGQGEGSLPRCSPGMAGVAPKRNNHGKVGRGHQEMVPTPL